METIIDLDLPYPACAAQYFDPRTLNRKPLIQAYFKQAEAACFIPKEKRYPEKLRRITATIHPPSDRPACDDSAVQFMISEVLDHLGLLPRWMMDLSTLRIFHGAPKEGGLLAVEIKDGGEDDCS